MTLLDLHWKFSIEDFRRMSEAGILPNDEGEIEFIAGQVMDLHPPGPHKFSVADYCKMAEVGILQEDDPVELIEGEIVEMAPTGSRHFAAVNRLNKQLVIQVGASGIVSIQNPVLLNNLTMPEPDLAVFTPSPDDYESGLPGPDKVLLLIEVADSSLQYDTRQKLPLYAGQGIAEYWLVDLVRARIDVFRHPSVDGYAEHLTFRGEDEVSPSTLPTVKVRVLDILG